jgi:hypothetical protein
MIAPTLFVLTLLALKTEIEGTQLIGSAGAESVLSIQTSREAAETEGWANIRKKYPEADGWFGHQVTVFELPPQIEMDDYHLAFVITKAGGAT